MKTINLAIATPFILLANLLPSWADGLVHNGHIAGPYTTLELTPKQISVLSHGTKIALTPSQKNTMLKDTGVSGVKQLVVFPRTTVLCSDDAANTAIRINNKSIEVADLFFGDEEEEIEDPGWEKRRGEWRANGQLERQMVNPPEEIQLHVRAEKLRESGESDKAIPLLEQAIKINPKYKWARRDLAECYLRLAGNPCGPLNELPRKIYYRQKALAVLNGDDAPVIRQIQQSLNRINARIASNKETPKQ